MGSVDRNLFVYSSIYSRSPSLPAWGAWIEIARSACFFFCLSVAPRMGSVDRNTEELNRKLKKRVAPHTGSVDRNESLPLELRREYVAPHTGSVDRNT